jgi:hypothetical protein
MKPPWLESWLGAPLDVLDSERLTAALDAARQIAERLAQEQDKPRSLKGHQELVMMRGEWQEAIAELLRARADRTPSAEE